MWMTAPGALILSIYIRSLHPVWGPRPVISEHLKKNKQDGERCGKLLVQGLDKEASMLSWWSYKLKSHHYPNSKGGSSPIDLEGVPNNGVDRCAKGCEFPAARVIPTDTWWPFPRQGVDRTAVLGTFSFPFTVSDGGFHITLSFLPSPTKLLHSQTWRRHHTQASKCRNTESLLNPVLPRFGRILISFLFKRMHSWTISNMQKKITENNETKTHVSTTEN